MRPHEEHRARGPKELSFWVVTVSTSRYEAMASGRSCTDESGDAAVSLISRAGHRVVGRSLVKDDLVMIRGVVMDLLRRSDVDVVVLTGGTGVARTDVTIEAVRPLLEKELDGFGDVFRLKSYQEVGTAAIMSRALAGVSNGKLVVALPGSPNAVETGLGIILPEAPHIIYLVRS
ncbi:MAG: MogA/MoaB family molybdenum cofactor biosynthesis protein [Thermoproteus sp.]